MRILVTGAGGFVGANLVRSWSTERHTVVGLLRPGSDDWRLADEGFETARIDLTDRDGLAQLVERLQPEAVVNSAAHGAYSSQQDFHRMVAVNIEAVETLIALCIRFDVPLLHLGSSSEYGVQDHPPHETERPVPNSWYAVSKVAGTHLVDDAVSRRSLRGLVLRLYSVYGRWEEPGRLMPALAQALVDQRLPPLVAPDIARDFVHIDDVVAASWAWIADPRPIVGPAVLNIGSGVQTTLGELVERVRVLGGIDDQPVWGSMKQRAWDTTCWVADPGRAEQVLGWRSAVPLDDGLTDLARFVAEHPDRYRT